MVRTIFKLGVGLISIAGISLTQPPTIIQAEQMNTFTTERTIVGIQIPVSAKESVEETELETEIEKPYSDEDYELLAKLIFAEAGTCEDTLILEYVGSVVLNRVASEEYPNTIADVIYQEEYGVQYATASYLDEIIPDERAYFVADELLRYGPNCPSDVIFQAEFIQGSDVYAHLENQYFCYR